MTDNTWTTEDETEDGTFTVTAGNYNMNIEDEVTAADVQDVAKDEGIKKFKVEDEDGNELDQAEFPIQSNVVVKEYNENA